eukprot:scaffold111204_cov19-Tisochrysis_lutea.AAC.1
MHQNTLRYSQAPVSPLCSGADFYHPQPSTSRCWVTFQATGSACARCEPPHLKGWALRMRAPCNSSSRPKLNSLSRSPRRSCVCSFLQVPEEPGAGAADSRWHAPHSSLVHQQRQAGCGASVAAGCGANIAAGCGTAIAAAGVQHAGRVLAVGMQVTFIIGGAAACADGAGGGGAAGTGH